MRPARLHPALLALAAAGLASCSTTQRLPGPLNPLPDGAVAPVRAAPGATRATVLRQADGVRIQRVGTPAGYALSAATARATVEAGSVVLTSGPGRAELLWDGSPASISLFGPGALRLGDSNAGEALVRLFYLDRARLHLGAADKVELPGGVTLFADPEIPTGPFALTTAGLGSIELANQSVNPVRLVVGDFELSLPGGAIVEIPSTDAAVGAKLSGGDQALLDRVQAGSMELGMRGDVRWSEEGGRVRLEADGPAEVHGMGIVLRLGAGESALLGPLQARAGGTGVQP